MNTALSIRISAIHLKNLVLQAKSEMVPKKKKIYVLHNTLHISCSVVAESPLVKQITTTTKKGGGGRLTIPWLTALKPCRTINYLTGDMGWRFTFACFEVPHRQIQPYGYNSAKR